MKYRICNDFKHPDFDKLPREREGEPAGALGVLAVGEFEAPEYGTFYALDHLPTGRLLTTAHDASMLHRLAAEVERVFPAEVLQGKDLEAFRGVSPKGWSEYMEFVTTVYCDLNFHQWLEESQKESIL